MEMMVERLESLKAAIIGGLSVGFACLITSLVNNLLLAKYLPILTTEENNFLDLHFWLSAGIAGFSGFLFGVTYRYIIRVDKNPQLKSGAVFAFGLVRGLTQIEFGLRIHHTLLPFLILAGESVLWFTVAALMLDTAMLLGWVKPFSSEF
ncbi:hypothetical protein A0J48_001685 [Sphaerospermopsis aphanizomenoides BCCUSP55]|nr:hypothetical protein [Sphaerospermopsis aphanizomenoides BCCUSP55]